MNRREFLNFVILATASFAVPSTLWAQNNENKPVPAAFAAVARMIDIDGKHMAAGVMAFVAYQGIA